MNIKIKLHQGGKLPIQATDGSAGTDCYANLHTLDATQEGIYLAKGQDNNPISMQVQPGATVLVPLGFACAFDSEYWMGVYVRSGLALKGIHLGNGAGVVDSDYRKEVCAILYNAGKNLARIDHGQRIAQYIMHLKIDALQSVVDELPETGRSGGFGSTGKA